MPGHLVASPPQSALGDIQHQTGLSYDKGGQFEVICLVIVLAEFGKSLLEFANRGGLSGQAMSAALVAQENGPGAKAARISRIAEYDMTHFDRTTFFEIGDPPGDAHRYNQRIGVFLEFVPEGVEAQFGAFVGYRQRNPVQFPAGPALGDRCVEPVEQIATLDTIARINHK